MLAMKKRRGDFMKNNRAQAALEFLMTYGWALLIVLVAIGVLAYFGVLSPARFLPQQCTLPPGFGCTDFRIQSSPSVLTVILQNGIGDVLSSVSMGYDASPTLSCSVAAGASGFILNDGSTTTVTMPLSACSLTAGARFKAVLILNYAKAQVPHSARGQIVGTAE